MYYKTCIFLKCLSTQVRNTVSKSLTYYHFLPCSKEVTKKYDAISFFFHSHKDAFQITSLASRNCDFYKFIVAKFRTHKNFLFSFKYCIHWIIIIPMWLFLNTTQKCPMSTDKECWHHPINSIAKRLVLNLNDYETTYLCVIEVCFDI